MVTVQLARAESACGTLRNHYGPYDYTNIEDRQVRLPIVEKHHFNADVESLKRGINGPVWTDLNYTLRTFPNHHRALYAMAMYQLKNPRPIKAPPRYLHIDCYFERAMRFKPDDGNVRLIHGIYLHRKGELQKSLKRYKEAESLLKERQSKTLFYNMSLLLLDMKKYDQAVIYAKKAYALGNKLPGLRKRLMKLGIWEGK